MTCGNSCKNAFTKKKIVFSIGYYEKTAGWVGGHIRSTGGGGNASTGGNAPSLCVLEMSSSVKQVQAAPPRGVSTINSDL